MNELDFKLLFDRAKNHFFIFIKNEKILSISKNVEEILGFKEEELINSEFKNLFVDNKEYLDFLNYIKEKSLKGIKIRLKTKNKKEKIFDVLMSNLKEDENSFFVVLKDITEDIKKEKLNQILFKLSKKFFEIKTLNELLKEIHNLLKEFIYAENFYVALIDLSNEYIYFPYFSDLKDEKPPPRKRRGGITEYVLEKGKGLLLKREEIEKLRDEGKLIFYGTSPESYIGVPLKIKGKNLGVIAIQSYEKEIVYDENDLNLLNFIAENISLMIERVIDEETHISLIKNLNGFIYQLIAEKQKFISIEGKFEEITGYKKEDFLEGRINYIDIIHKDDFKNFKENFYNLVEGKVESITDLYRIKTKNGDIKWLSSSSRILYRETPQTTIISGFVMDVTENINLREKLFETEIMFKTLFERSPIGLAMTDRDGKIFASNDAFLKMIGYSLDEIKNISWREYTHPDDIEKDWILFQKLINKEIDSYSIEKRFITKDKRIIYANLNCAAVFDENGEFRFEFAMIEDITEKKKLQEALIESERKFRLLFEKNPLGVVMADEKSDFAYTNEIYQKMLGYTGEELKKLSMKDVTYPEDYIKQEELIKKLKNKEIDSFNLEKRYIRKDGSIFWANLFASSILDDSGNVKYLVGMVKDITEEKRLREELEESRRRLSRSLDNVLNLITKIIEMKDPFTLGHQAKVAYLAKKIAEKMNLPKEKIEAIYIASMLHDIGKIVVPTEILNKGGKLSENEYSLIKEHCKNGYEILKKVDFLYPIADIVLQHHERLNGSGYPLGLKDDEILLEARIIAVTDVFEAMTSHRPYRPAFKLEDVLKHLKDNKGILYEPEVVDILEEIVINKEINFNVN
jgi:PAS domain S-box-containing protein/putative nucleotidyltransferase with HDIG domain